MSVEALSIVVYALLAFGAVAVQASYLSLTAGVPFGFSNREDAPPEKGPAGQRIDKTLANLKEGAVMYLPLALLAVGLDISNGWTSGAAVVAIVSILLYVPIFYLGIPVVRTLVWAPGFLSIPVLAVGFLVDAP